MGSRKITLYNQQFQSVCLRERESLRVCVNVCVFMCVCKLLLFVKVGECARMNDESENMERKEDITIKNLRRQGHFRQASIRERKRKRFKN